MSIHTPDITRSNPLCVVNDQIFAMYTTNQVYKFEVPVYYDSIKILPMTSDPNDPDNYLTEDIDYIVNETNTTEIGKIKLAHPEWDYTLVDSIVLKNPSSEVTNMSISFRQIMPDIVQYNSYLGSNIEVTPDYIIALQQQVQQNKSQLSTLYRKSQFTNESEYVQFIDMDVLGTNINNKITNEIHLINSISNKIVIAPNFGSYYSNTLTIVDDTTDIELVEGVDYSFKGSNINKNRISLSSDEIYDYIIINKSIHGKVRISYQAFGGSPSLSNFKELYDQVNNINNYLGKNHFISEESLGSTDNLITINDKINILENKMRNLIKEGTPTYADVTSGTTSRFKVTSLDHDLNWYSIAELYKVDGSPFHVLADVFDFHMEFLDTSTHIEGSILVDRANKRLQVNIINNTEYEIDGYGLHFRVVWNNVAPSRSGMILQVGFKLPNNLTETFSIEDKSGKEGCWLLLPSNDAAIGPSNTSILLPDGTSIWDENQNESEHITMPAILYTGTIISDDVGAVTMNGPLVTNVTKFTLTSDLMQSVKSITAQIWRGTTPQTTYNVNIIPTQQHEFGDNEDASSALTGSGYFYDDDGNRIEVKIKIVSDTIEVSLIASTYAAPFTNMHAYEIKLY